MAVNCPVNIKYCAISPYALNVKMPIIEDENEIGLSTRRRRSSNPIYVHNMTLCMSHEDFSRFNNWVNDELFGGVFDFYFTPPYSDEIKTGRLVFSNASWFSNMEMTPGSVTFAISVEETGL